MAKRKIQYYLDETDQIEVDGHTLSRLYVKENYTRYVGHGNKTNYPVFGEDNSNRKMGGYVESLDNLSHNIDMYGDIAWVEDGSVVYGNSKIGTGCLIRNSTVIDSDVKPYTITSHVFDSTVINSTVGEVTNSIVTNSTCNRLVQDSTVKDSTIKIASLNSTVENSTISGSKNAYIKNANITNVVHKGGISGTFSDANLGDIKTHPMSVFTPSGYTSQFNLLEGPYGEFALNRNSEYSGIRLGGRVFDESDVNFDELYDLLHSEVNGRIVGKQPTLEKLEEIRNGMTLTDSDLDFGEVGRGL